MPPPARRRAGTRSPTRRSRCLPPIQRHQSPRSRHRPARPCRGTSATSPSAGSRKAAEKPKAEKPAAEAAEAEKHEAAEGERVPFYKRELSFGGKKADGPKATTPSKSKSQKGSTPSKQLKRVTGLKIGGSQLAAARVHNNGVPELVQVARQELEPGIIVGGELRDPEALVSALKDFFKRHKLPRQGVRLGIANNRIGVRDASSSSGIDDVKQLENAVRFRAHEALPIPIEDAVIDWQILDEWEDEEGVTRRILLVVAYRDLARPLCRRVQEGRHQARRDRSRSVRAPAGDR